MATATMFAMSPSGFEDIDEHSTWLSHSPMDVPSPGKSLPDGAPTPTGSFVFVPTGHFPDDFADFRNLQDPGSLANSPTSARSLDHEAQWGIIGDTRTLSLPTNGNGQYSMMPHQHVTYDGYVHISQAQQQQHLAPGIGANMVAPLSPINTHIFPASDPTSAPQYIPQRQALQQYVMPPQIQWPMNPAFMNQAITQTNLIQPSAQDPWSLTGPLRTQGIPSAAAPLFSPVDDEAHQHDHLFSHPMSFSNSSRSGSLEEQSSGASAASSSPKVKRARLSKARGAALATSPIDRRQRTGGRARGSNLKDASKQNAREMRLIGSCWHCVFQRDKCQPGEPCPRCLKRASRLQHEHGFSCVRTKLPDLRDQLYPNVITSLHEHDVLYRFVEQHVGSWTSNFPIRMHLTSGHGPPISVEVYEFAPKTQELTRTFIHSKNPVTGKYEQKAQLCPPVAIISLEEADFRRLYETYLDNMVTQHLDGFAHEFFEDEEHDFHERLLQLICDFYVVTTDSDLKKLLSQLLQLIFVAYIMGRTLSIVPSTKPTTLQNLMYSTPDMYTHEHVVPRMTQRQVKYIFCAIQRQLLSDVLQKLQQILRNSKINEKWIYGFVCVLGLGIVFEDTQRTIHCVAKNNIQQGLCGEAEGEWQKMSACQGIEKEYLFLANLFKCKYNRVVNPLLKNTDPTMDGLVGVETMAFVRQVICLMFESDEMLRFLFERSDVPLLSDNDELYASRLTTKFLLSFWNQLENENLS